jgi:hypothetical protein
VLVLIARDGLGVNRRRSRCEAGSGSGLLIALDQVGRVMLAAISDDQETIFENAVGIEYPKMGFAPVDTAFDRLIDWIACPPSKSSTSDSP